ncbi:conjugal transfer protein TrbI [Sphingomonas sp. R647]|uniref:TrbI/VirB10 family protein n=1 Tax=Sphingomonas sp. R647 TaxID=2875233 RepID=UPI001CD58D7A|nr:TrbI/VirB10 family protein [Sphingomonas sp. R647]MCA1199418.1 conjugal transfer protein TrbI [Sphingomonas sp. R647]
MSAVGDPRRDPAIHAAGDIRPMVGAAPRGPSMLIIGGGLGLAAILLFVALESRRTALQAPAVTRSADAPTALREPPPLYIPPAPVAEASAPPVAVVTAPQTVPFVLPQPPMRQQRPEFIPQPPPPVYPQPLPPPPMAEPRAAAPGPLVLDRSGPQDDGPGVASADTPAGAQAPGTRVTAGSLANRSTTIAQGTLIPAVLETGFDSTKAGFARAIVSRDVRSFDGTRILIPRGSRLTGDYAGGAEAGQKRAIINWSRLVRPDGVTIAIGSPATDAVGRNGVRAKVNSHLLQRIFPALLQSALDIGVNLATRPANGSILLALPNSASSATSGQNGPAPTLSVRPGTTIAVFVTRDLDFTGVGNPR